MFTYARVLRFVSLASLVVIMIVGAPTIGVFAEHPSAWVPLGLIGVFFVYVAVRGLLLRAEVGLNVLRIRQWFRTTEIPIDRIEMVESISYAGLLNMGGIGDLGMGAFTPMIKVVRTALSSPISAELPATISPFWTADRKLARLRAALDSATAARPSGDSRVD